jgi:carotenoid cleavage dioxygenase-like enzyme
VQIHCIPRPGKNGRKRPIYEASSQFAFHHINAFEAEGGRIVVDTLSSRHIAFESDLTSASTAMYKNASRMTTPKRLVLDGQLSRAMEFDMADAADLVTFMEFPAQLPAQAVGKAYNCFFATVRAARTGGFFGCNSPFGSFS